MKQFTNAFLLLFFSSFFFQSCLLNVNSIKGNGTLVSKEINITDYQELVLQSGADIVYEHKSHKEPYLQLCVDENILPYIEVKAEDGKLIIKSVENSNISPTKFKVYTNSSNLSRVKLSGSGEIHLKGEVNSKLMAIDISGSGGLVTDSLYTEKLDLTISGSGGATLSGVANTASYNISGSGGIDGFNYLVQNLKCRVSGSGSMRVFASEKLDASISGSGGIRYKGNPSDIKQKVSGSGSVSSEN